MLTKAERRKIALKNLKKAHAARRSGAKRGHRRGMRESGLVVYQPPSEVPSADADAKKAERAAAKKKLAAKKRAAAKRAEPKIKMKAANDNASKPRKASKPKAAAKASPKTASTKRNKPVANKKGSEKGKNKQPPALRRYWAAQKALKAGKPAAAKKATAKSKAKKAAGRKLSAEHLAKMQRSARRYRLEQRKRPSTARMTKKNKGVTVHVTLQQPKRAAARRAPSKRKSNPIEGGKQWATGFLGFVVGGVSVSFFDRIAATHALTAGVTAQGNTGTYTDAPAAGQLYNAEAVGAPLWSSPMRLLVAAVAIATPYGIAAGVEGPAAKTFFQLFGFGAVAATGVKAVNDLVAMITTSSGFGQRLYAPEIMSQTDMAALKVNGTPLPALTAPVRTAFPASSPPTLAALPRQARPRWQLPAAQPQQMAQSQQPMQRIVEAPQAQQSAQSISPAQNGLAGLPTEDGRRALDSYLRSPERFE